MALRESRPQMSDVSSIRAAPPHSAPAPRRTAEAPKGSDRENSAPSEKQTASAALPNKTKVQTEQVGKFAYAYTFIDAETRNVVGRYPAEPFVSANRGGGKIA